MTKVPNPIGSRRQVLGDPPPDLNLTLGQQEVGAMPDEPVGDTTSFWPNVKSGNTKGEVSLYC